MISWSMVWSVSRIQNRPSTVGYVANHCSSAMAPNDSLTLGDTFNIFTVWEWSHGAKCERRCICNFQKHTMQMKQFHKPYANAN